MIKAGEWGQISNSIRYKNLCSLSFGDGNGMKYSLIDGFVLFGYRCWNRIHSGGLTRDMMANSGISTTTAQIWSRPWVVWRASWNTPFSKALTSPPGRVSFGENTLTERILVVYFLNQRQNYSHLSVLVFVSKYGKWPQQNMFLLLFSQIGVYFLWHLVCL